jgi:hypothetical protein
MVPPRGSSTLEAAARGRGHGRLLRTHCCLSPSSFWAAVRATWAHLLDNRRRGSTTILLLPTRNAWCARRAMQHGRVFVEAEKPIRDRRLSPGDSPPTNALRSRPRSGNLGLWERDSATEHRKAMSDVHRGAVRRRPDRVISAIDVSAGKFDARRLGRADSHRSGVAPLVRPRFGETPDGDVVGQWLVVDQRQRSQGPGTNWLLY